MNNENEKRNSRNSLSKFALGGAALSSTAVMAAEGGSFGTTASGEISSAKSDVTVVGMAIIGVACLVFVVKLVKRLIGG